MRLKKQQFSFPYPQLASLECYSVVSQTTGHASSIIFQTSFVFSWFCIFYHVFSLAGMHFTPYFHPLKVSVFPLCSLAADMEDFFFPDGSAPSFAKLRFWSEQAIKGYISHPSGICVVTYRYAGHGATDFSQPYHISLECKIGILCKFFFLRHCSFSMLGMHLSPGLQSSRLGS